jgi:hypothetical protein
MSALPFDHLTLAEVVECERLVAAHRARILDGFSMARLRDLLAKRHRPLYSARRPEPPRAA